MPSIRVLRPFLFSYPLKEGQRFAKERHLVPGDQEIDDEIASHPWIKDHFADGCIETPEQAQQRLADAKAIARKAEDDAKLHLAQAEAALKRAEATSPDAKGEEEKIKKALNTPVNALQNQQGAGITQQDGAGTEKKAKESKGGNGKDATGKEGG